MKGQRDGTAGPGEVAAGPGREEVSVSVHPQGCPGRGHPGPHLSTTRSPCLPGVCVRLSPLLLCQGTGEGGGAGKQASNKNFTPSKSLEHHQTASPVPRVTWPEHGGLTLWGGLFPPENLSGAAPSAGLPRRGMLGTPPELPGHQPCPGMQGLAGLHPPCGSLWGSLRE